MKNAFLPAVALTLLAGRANAADAPSYTKDVKPFLKTYCLDCHGGRQTKKGVSVESIATMMKGRSILVAGTPEKSRLYLVMTGGGKQMPPRKYGKSPTRDEIAMIKAWIAAGAKDDTDDKKTTPDTKDPKESKEETAAPRRQDYDPHASSDE